MPFGHETDVYPRNRKHLFGGKVPNIILRYESEGVLNPAISDDLVTNLTDGLNKDSERYRYSTQQVKAALWNLLGQRVDDLVDVLDEHWEKLSIKEQNSMLGDPELDMKEEAYYAAGDAKFDAMRDGGVR
jgi:hypothetical protein